MAEEGNTTEGKVEKTETQSEQTEKNQDADPQRTGNMIPEDRFKSVIAERNEARKALEDLKAKQAEAEEKALAEQGKYKDLYEKSQSEIKTLIAKNEYNEKRMAVLAALSMPDVRPQNPNDIIAFIDFEKLQIVDDVVTGIEEQIKLLQEGKPYLFNKDKPADTDKTNLKDKPAGDVDWGKAAREMAPADFKALYRKTFGMDPPGT